MMEMIICRRCGRETPAIANYCKSCRGNPRPRQDKLWSGEKLEVTDITNFVLLMEAIFNEKMEETPSANAVRWALLQLTQKQEQVLIRLYGLDNSGRRRTLTEIAKEEGISRLAVGQKRDAGLRLLRHRTRGQVLLGHRPVPE